MFFSAFVRIVFCFWIFILINASSAIAQSMQPLEIIPAKDYYYIKNWPVQGNVKSIRIHRYQPRSASERFITFEACRLDVHSRDKYATTEEYYTFNKKGQLTKRVVESYKGKHNTLYEYNFFDKISVVETIEKQTKYFYDADGRLTSQSFYEGARQTMVTNVHYFGDTILSVTSMGLDAPMDTLKECVDKKGRIIYRAQKLTGFNWKEDFFEYDSLNRVVKNWNSLDYYFEYEYDDRGRVVKSYIRPDKSFMALCTYDDLNGICRTSRCEQIEGNYVERNYDCVCTIIDGQNNPIKREFIDCEKNGAGDTFRMNGFIEVEYEYFK